MSSETVLLSNNNPDKLSRASKERDNFPMSNYQAFEMAVILKVDQHLEKSVKCQVKDVKIA